MGTLNIFWLGKYNIYIYNILYSMCFYDFAKIQCLHYTGWSRGVDSFLENLLKAKNYTVIDVAEVQARRGH